MILNEQQIAIIKDCFKDKLVFKAYISGSYARGDADEKSDVDLLVDWDYSQLSGWDYMGYSAKLKSLLKIKVDFVSAHWLSPYIANYTDADKRLIYER
jgi:uncharacterized protein